jgi:hypothetical protein
MIEPGAGVERAADLMDGWIEQFEIPGAAHYGLDESMVEEIAAAPSSSINTNPVELDSARREQIISSLL